MPTILDNIVAVKREEVAKAKTERPESTLRRRVADAPPARFSCRTFGRHPRTPDQGTVPFSLRRKSGQSHPADCGGEEGQPEQRRHLRRF